MSLKAHVAEAFAECNDTRKLLMEWRDAREAFLGADHASPSTFEARKPLFDRLANAEGALMAYARQYQVRRETPAVS